MQYKIYKLTNSVTGKHYIGYTSKTLEERFKGHVSGARKGLHYKISRAILKYGEAAFTMNLLYECDDRKEVGRLEDEYIIRYDTIRNGYNIARGGQGGCIILFPEHPNYEDVCKKISIAQKKRSKELSEQAKKQHANGGIRPKDFVFSEESRKKMSKGRKGKKNTPEHIEKQRASLLATYKSEGYVNPNKGRKCSEETKRKISETHADVNGDKNPMFGKCHSSKTKEKQREKALVLPKIVCEHCGTASNPGNFSRWHGENCKHRAIS